jgi:hypothetical protein
VHITGTGIVRVQSKDHGGGEIRIVACFVDIEGLVNAGGGREKVLPVIIEVIAHEFIQVHNGGQVVADLSEGFRQHHGQELTDPSLGFGRGCEFYPTDDPQDNGPLTNAKGGADICFTARSDSAQNAITIDGTLVTGLLPTFQTNPGFAVSAQTTTGSQTGGTVLALGTGLVDTGDDTTITLLGKAITVNGTQRGGIVSIQADDNVDVNGVVLAKDASGGGTIHIQGVNGTVTGTPGGQLDAGLGGSVRLLSCNPVVGFPPATSTPAPVIVILCADPELVELIPILQPCSAPACFCILRLNINGQGDLLRVIGKDFRSGSTIFVTRVDVNAPSCDPGSGTSATFTVTSPSTLNLTPPVAVTSATKVVLSGAGPDGIPGTTDDLASSCIVVP